ncbi:MAG TPA: hypothetical protein PLU10_10015 [Chitinophagaceae bacterium]|nr:hypothetical protein [Chitinophagaceae bacterium]
MKTSLLKSILVGASIGAVLFLLPHFIIGCLIFFAVMKLFFFRRSARRFGAYGFMGMADRIRSMSPEEYESFKHQRGAWNHSCCHSSMSTSQPSPQA